MGRLHNPLGRLSTRARPAAATLLVTLAAAGTLVAAGLTRGFARDLLLNLGASMAFVPPTYLVFAPIFERLRQTAAAIREHMRLDRSAVTDGVRGSRWVVQVMATWSSMLEAPYHKAFLQALGLALGNGAVVRILLLDPDSIAAAQRTRELDGLDVRRLIDANLRQLYAFAEQVDAASRRRLQIRIYDASPSMQMFRWDDKVLISFFPLHHRVAAARQIETFISNPLGEFAQSRFDELWGADTTREIEQYMRILVGVHNREAGTVAVEPVEFVRHLDHTFIDATPLLAHLVRHGIDELSAVLHGTDGAPVLPMAQFASCPADQRGSVPALFERKYGRPRNLDVIVRLG